MIPAQVPPRHNILPGLSPVALLKLLTYHRTGDFLQHKCFSLPLFFSMGAAGFFTSAVMFSPSHGIFENLVAILLPGNKSPTVSVFLQVLAPVPESSETHRGQIFPPEQEHDYATYHEALPVA